MPGTAIGAIQIEAGYSLVDVATPAANDIVRALATATIKGRTVPVRIER